MKEKYTEMLPQVVGSLVLEALSIAYSWLQQNLVSPLLTFSRGFEFAIILSAAMLFMLISVFLFLRQAKKLPQSYIVEIIDLYGEKTAIDGVRQTFTTHDAAESYARMYQHTFGLQYRFRVVGTTEQIPDRTS